MARPKTKEELIETSQKNYKKLNELLNSFSDKEKKSEFLKGTLNNVSSILAAIDF